MMMFRPINHTGFSWGFFFLVLIFFSCRASSKESPKKPSFNTFILADSTVLKLPASFFLAEKGLANLPNTPIYTHFLQGLSEPPLQEKYLIDTLSEKHVLAVYQVTFQDYNQNMAALMNTALTRQFIDLDEQFPCYSIDKIESMQYASAEWNALKFKYKLSPEASTGCPKQPIFTTLFYFNGHNRAFYFVETSQNANDLDAFLRKIQLGQVD